MQTGGEGQEERPATRNVNDKQQEITTPEESQHAETYQSRQARLPAIHGVALWLLVLVLFLSLLLSFIEQFIVGTALTNIASDLGHYDQSSWVVTAYLMSYNGFLVVFARSSDIYGRRSTFLLALSIFTAASLACGLASVMTQLIVFRAFQGIGGAGLFTLALNVSTEIPGKARTVVNALVPAAFGLGAGAAPVIGGAIVARSTWRWVFLLNVPGGALLLVVAYLVFPRNAVRLNLKLHDLLRMDWPGTILLLGAVVTLNFALQEGSVQYPWSSAQVIGTLIGSVICWVAFFTWETILTTRELSLGMLPIWPARLFRGRVICCAMISAFLAGIPMYSLYIYLPQRFELVNSQTPLMSGVHLLIVPLVSFYAQGTATGICTVKNLSYYLLIGALALQAIGLGLLSGQAPTEHIAACIYGYEVLIGVGFGLGLPAVGMIARTQSGHLDHSVNMAAISSLRSLGGTIGVSIGNIVLSRVVARLSGSLDPAQLEIVANTPDQLTGFTVHQTVLVRNAFACAYDLIWKIDMAFALAALLAGLGCFSKNPLEIKEMDIKEMKEKEEMDATARGDMPEGDHKIPVRQRI